MTTEDISFVPAQRVIDRLMTDTYDDNGVMEEKYATWVYAIWKEVSRNYFRKSRTVLLKISPSTRTIRYPSDASRILGVGVDNGCGRFAPLSVDNNLLGSLQLEDGRNICKECGTEDLCKKMKYEVFEEVVTVEGMPYTKVITRIIGEDGSYVEEVNEPIAQYDTTGFTEVIMVKSKKLICSLEVAACGCVSQSDSNVKKLCECGSLMACLCCDNANQLYAVKDNAYGSYKDFPAARFIQISPESCLTEVYVMFEIRALCMDGIYYFPEDAVEALVSGAYWKSIEKNLRVSRWDRKDALVNYTSELKKLRSLIGRWDIDRIIEIFSTPPRIIIN